MYTCVCMNSSTNSLDALMESARTEEPVRRTTAPASVSPETDLANLNLDWTERELPERERTKHVHRLHPYLGKFVPQLSEIFLRKFFSPGETVLDPFMGSGTTLIQANELGVNAVGYDISAFNVLLSRAKTARYDLTQLKLEIDEFLGATAERASGHEALPGTRFQWTNQISDVAEYLRDWYSASALRQILAAKSVIDDSHFEYADLIRIILSRAARSARLAPHYDLEWPKKPVTEEYYCYKHRRMCGPTQDAMKFISRYAIDTLRRVSEFDTFRTDATVEIRHANCLRARFPRVDGVVTSPPYVGLIDYHRQHAYAYHLFGLKDRSAEEIGAGANGSSAGARANYVAQISGVFRRALSAMPRGGKLIVVAGDRHNLYGEIRDRIGVKEVNVIDRHVNRRTGRRSTDFYESVFVWEKT